MSLTVVLSGPKAAERQARTALAGAGFALSPSSHDHGLPADSVDPEHRPKRYKAPRQAIAFLTCEAEDVDAPLSAVDSLGYVLRMHFETPEPPEPSLEQLLVGQMAEMQAEIDALKAGR